MKKEKILFITAFAFLALSACGKTEISMNWCLMDINAIESFFNNISN